MEFENTEARVTELQKKLILDLSEKDQLVSENQILREELLELQILYSQLIESSSCMQNCIEAGSKDAHYVPICLSEDVNNTLFKTLKQKLSFQMVENERLQKENQTLLRKLHDFQVEFAIVKEHSDRIENELDKQVQREMILSVTDHLTGAFNRLKFSTALEALIKNLKQYENRLYIILFDIDNFKLINDTFGHVVGDTVLVEISELMKKIIRKTDIFARWGGEEFTVLLPGYTLEESAILAERIRMVIAGHKFPVAGRVTCSFGLTGFLPKDDVISFIKRVDQALYEAKNDGKNCIKIKFSESN